MMTKKTKALAILAMMLNLFDAWSTLFILDHGGTEVNPVMNYVINVSPWFFVSIKVILFGLAIYLLATRAAHHLRWIVLLYGALALWHIYLLRQIYLYSIGIPIL
jgi:hypothetical protein|tara:strand:- start:1867 stop:2181 length:315 start_codon:yes stop_codon:yes gene_type:complete